MTVGILRGQFPGLTSVDTTSHGWVMHVVHTFAVVVTVGHAGIMGPPGLTVRVWSAVTAWDLGVVTCVSCCVLPW